MNKKVLIGLSGGVDSAVAAYLLQRAGYDVVGCFMRNWDSITNNDIEGNPTLSGSKCSQELDYDDALKTAEQLGIELLRVDFIQEYWDEVFSNFLEEYERGRTPNPDIFCNKYIKFEAFRRFAIDHGFDQIAMGHYAKKVVEHGFSYLYKARDQSKDQSYFLAQIDEEQLRMSLFPLAEITKTEVRQLAEQLNLAIAHKKDSTGVCFIGERNFKKFLQNYIPAQPGDIIDVKSKSIVGQHEGVYYYTIGQHRGLAIGGQANLDNLPFFVVGKDVKRNILYVGQEINRYMKSFSMQLAKINWLLPSPPTNSFECMAKFRYRAKDLPVRVEIVDDIVRLFYPGYDYITVGQLAVLYDGDRLLGSGIIDQLFDEQGKIIDFSTFR